MRERGGRGEEEGDWREEGKEREIIWRIEERGRLERRRGRSEKAKRKGEVSRKRERGGGEQKDVLSANFISICTATNCSSTLKQGLNHPNDSGPEASNGGLPL